MGSASVRRGHAPLMLTVGLTFAAALALAWFGLRAIGDRERAAAVNYTATSVLIRDRLLAEVHDLDAGRRRPPLPATDGTRPVQDWLREAGSDSAVLIRRGGGVASASLTMAWEPARVTSSDGGAVFLAAMREAEHREFVQDDLDGAIASYQAALKAAITRSARLLALARVGRTWFKRHAFDRALAAYRDLERLAEDATDGNGIPFAVVAKLQIADALDASNRAAEAAQARRELLTWMLDHPWDGRDGYGYYLARAREWTAPPADIDRRVAQQLAGLDRLEWLDDVVRPLIESEAGTADRTRPRVVDRNGTAVIVHLHEAGRFNGSREAWLGTTVTGDDLAGPLLARVLSGVDLGRDLAVTLVDADGRDVRTARSAPVSLASAELGVVPGWRVALIDRNGRTIHQLGARERWIYGSLVLGTVVVLMAGVLIAARAWAREAELSRLRADFVSNVSHELKTPLALIRMFGETLESGLVSDPSEQREFHGIIRRESERLTHLIDNVLDIGKIDAGTKRFVLASADLRALLMETVDAYAPLLEQLGFTVTLDVPDAPVTVEMDTSAIAQALVNLLQNAIKYSAETRELRVSIVAGHGTVRLAVADRGIGIPASELSRIFEKYYRAPSADTLGTAGSGLGLAIVQHVMAAHGGAVEAKSVVGEGSTFTLAFPQPIPEPAARAHRVTGESARGAAVN